MRTLALALALALAPAGCGKPARAPQPTPVKPRPTVAPSPSPSKPPTLSARALRVADPAVLPQGAAASGIVGDYLLENERIAAVVSDLGRSEGFGLSGGNLIDLAPRGGEDQFGQAFTYLDADFPRQAMYDRIEATRDGDVAVVRVSGHDSKNADILIVTEYRLAPGRDYLELRTTVTSETTQPAYELGDVLQWGLSQHFLPGIGFVFKGKTELPWIGSVSDTTSYGYTAQGKQSLGGLHGSTWSDVIVATADLAPKQPVTYVRFFGTAPRGDAAAAQKLIAGIRGDSLTTATGRVTEAGTGKGVAGALVTARDAAGVVLTTVRTDSEGRFVAPLPQGTPSQLDASAPSRGTSPSVAATAKGKAELTLPQPGMLRYHVSEGGAPSPCKLSFAGIAPTPDPDLGPAYRAAGARTVALSATGEGSVALPPGRYSVTVSRGMEYDVALSEQTIEPGATAELHADLRRVVDTTGYIAADLHQHARPSTDSSVSLTDRVISNLAEGVELMVGSDHNAISDYAPVIAELQAGARLAWVPGDEATTHNAGHFNAFPMTPDPTLPRGGAPAAENRDPRDIVRDLRAFGGGGDRVVQINHPRAGDVGYFDIIKLDPAVGPPEDMLADFDAIEVMNGKRASDISRTLPDWFMLLGRGLRVTATGNSDSHMIFGQEAGYPRNFIAVDRDEPGAVDAAQLVRALREKRDVVVTNGPFVRVRLGGKSALGTTVLAKKAVVVELEVQAAPWVDVTTVEVWRSGKSVQQITVPASREVIRLKTKITLAPAKKPEFVVFTVRGQRLLEPVAGRGPDTPAPMAITNPVFLTPR